MREHFLRKSRCRGRPGDHPQSTALRATGRPNHRVSTDDPLQLYSLIRRLAHYRHLSFLVCLQAGRATFFVARLIVLADITYGSNR